MLGTLALTAIVAGGVLTVTTGLYRSAQVLRASAPAERTDLAPLIELLSHDLVHAQAIQTDQEGISIVSRISLDPTTHAWCLAPSRVRYEIFQVDTVPGHSLAWLIRRQWLIGQPLADLRSDGADAQFILPGIDGIELHLDDQHRYAQLRLRPQTTSDRTDSRERGLPSISTQSLSIVLD